MPQQLCPRLGPSDALLGARLPEKGSALSLCHVPERCGGVATVLLWKNSHICRSSRKRAEDTDGPVQPHTSGLLL